MYKGVKERLCCIVTALCLFFSVSGTALADGEEVPTERLEAGEDAAWTLHELGLMSGMSQEADGTPNFGLELSVDRASAVTMLVRVLGGEKEAKAMNYLHPFQDSTGWMSPYVGYAYAHGITSGTSTPGSTVMTFSPTAPLTANEFLTWILRALGYVNVDWRDPRPLADQVGLAYPEGEGYYRADMAVTALSALDCAAADGTVLRKRLIESGAIPVSSLTPDVTGGATDPFGPVDPFDPAEDTGASNAAYPGASGFTPGPAAPYTAEVTLASLADLPTALAGAARGHAERIRVRLPGGDGSALALSLADEAEVITDMCDAVSLTVLETGADTVDVGVSYSDAARVMALTESRLASPDQETVALYNAAVRALLSAALPGDDTFSVVLGIHDYILEHSTYGAPFADAGNAAGPLLSGGGDSEGYARAFRLLCYMAGIDCVLIRGAVLAPTGILEDRTWNKVCVDGAWYNVDLSSDDTGIAKYNYFLVSDAAIATDHIPNPDRPLWPNAPWDYAVG